MSKITLHADPNCIHCLGSGEFEGDWVDYGSTRAQLPSEPCECILEQLPEDFDDWENVEIVGVEENWIEIDEGE